MDEMNVQNAQELSTTSVNAETQQEVDAGAELDTVPQGEENTDETSAQVGAENSAEENNEPTPPFLEIQYNHEKRGLSREEATTLAQKGIYYQSTYDTLQRAATLKGLTVEEFLNGIETAQDEAYRQELIGKFGDDEDTVNKMMELYQINKQKTLDAAALRREEEKTQAEQTVNERLAAEFTEMLGEFDGLTDFASLPIEVKQAAMDGMSLSHAYLKYLHRENKKIAAQKASEEAAAKKSTGSLGCPDSEGKTSFENGFLQGLMG